MQKDELINMHQLFACLYKTFNKQLTEGVTIDRYEDVEVSAYDYHGGSRKDQHKNAVLSLAADIAESIEEQNGQAKQVETQASE